MFRRYYQSSTHAAYRNHIEQYDIHTQRALADEYGVMYQSDYDLPDALASDLPIEYWKERGFRE